MKSTGSLDDHWPDARHTPHRLRRAWLVVGLALLAWIVVIAIGMVAWQLLP